MPKVVIDTKNCPFRTDNSECTRTNEDCFDDNDVVYNNCPLLKNGTPLPKGHGDLVDRNEVARAVYAVELDAYYINSVNEVKAVIKADSEG